MVTQHKRQSESFSYYLRQAGNYVFTPVSQSVSLYLCHKFLFPPAASSCPDGCTPWLMYFFPPYWMGSQFAPWLTQSWVGNSVWQRSVLQQGVHISWCHFMKLLNCSTWWCDYVFAIYIYCFVDISLKEYICYPFVLLYSYKTINKIKNKTC